MIDNSGEAPELVKWCESDMCDLEAGKWDEIRSRVRTVLPPASERGAAEEQLRLSEQPASPGRRGGDDEATRTGKLGEVCVPL